MKIKRAKSTTTRNHYVTNTNLLPAVIKAKEQGKVTDELIRMIRMIAERYSRKSNFIGYSFREDMVSAAVMNLCNNALKFKPEKSVNPFSYYTTGIHNSFLQYMADEKKHRNIKDALLIDAGANPSFNYNQNGDDNRADVDDDILKESDEIDITKNKPLEADDIPAIVAPVDIGEILGITRVSRPSYTRQVFYSLDPGPPGKNKLSSHPDHNPGPVTIYGPDDWIQDPVTGKVTLKEKVPEEPAKPPPAAPRRPRHQTSRYPKKKRSPPVPSPKKAAKKKKAPNKKLKRKA